MQFDGVEACFQIFVIHEIFLADIANYVANKVVLHLLKAVFFCITTFTKLTQFFNYVFVYMLGISVSYKKRSILRKLKIGFGKQWNCDFTKMKILYLVFVDAHDC